MAQIVIGAACSRSPLVTTPGENWGQLGERDKQNKRMIDGTGKLVSYDELLARVKPSVAKEIMPEVFQQKAARVQKAMQTIADRIEQANPDLVVVLGDDEEEYIHEDNRPGILLYRGATFLDKPRRGAPPGGEEKEYPVAVDLCNYLMDYLVNAEFDMSDSTKMEAMAHGFPFMYHYMLRKTVPIVPFIINIHYPPNQPTARRCYNLGRTVRSALEAWNNPAHIAIIANGGLSVFVVEEELDRRALTAMQNKDMPALCALPGEWMQGSTGEVRAWIAAAGALEHLKMDILDYLPGYRSPAGTGTGLGFAVWS